MPSSGARSRFAHSLSLVGKRAVQLSLRASLAAGVVERDGSEGERAGFGAVDEGERAEAGVVVRGEGRESWGSE